MIRIIPVLQYIKETNCNMQARTKKTLPICFIPTELVENQMITRLAV